MGRPGTQGGGAVSHAARGPAGARHLVVGFHDAAGSGHRGRRLRRRVPQACDRRGPHRRAAPVRRHACHCRHRLVRPRATEPASGCVLHPAGRAGGERSSRGHPGGARAGRPGRRLDQGVRGLPLGPGRQPAADLHAGGAHGAGGDRALIGPAGGRACDHCRGHAPRRAGRRGQHRTRLRRHGRGVQAHGGAPRGLPAHAHRTGGVRRVFRALPARQVRAHGRHAAGRRGFQDGAQGGSHHRLRERCRGLHPRHELSRASVDGA